MRTTRGFTILELMAVLVLIAIVLGFLLLPAMGARRRHSPQMKNYSQLRGVHQSAVIFSMSNNGYLPGLDREGIPLINGDTTGNSGPGDSTAARFWVLLNGQFIPGTMLINPMDDLTAWSTGTLTSSQYSYAALDISAGTGGQKGRRAEWRDNASSKAIHLSDRNVGASTKDADVRSVWSPFSSTWVDEKGKTHYDSPSDWRGAVVWGDGATVYEHSSRQFTTRYNGVTTTDDNLFASTSSAGVTDDATDSGANALMTWP